MSNSTTKITKQSKNKSTTGTGKNTALLGIPNITEPSYDNNTNINSPKRSMNKSINSTNNENNLIELKSKTNELQSKLDKLNSELEQEHFLLMEETSQYNCDLTERGLEISALSSENKDLLIEKNLTESVMKMENITKEKLDLAEKINYKNSTDTLVETDEFGFFKNKDEKDKENNKNNNNDNKIEEKKEIL